MLRGARTIARIRPIRPQPWLQPPRRSVALPPPPRLSAHQGTSRTSSLATRAGASSASGAEEMLIAASARRASQLNMLGNTAYIAIASGFLMTDYLCLRAMLSGGYLGLVSPDAILVVLSDVGLGHYFHA